MRIPRIYSQQLLKTGDQVQLDDRAFQHSIKVLRLKVNSEIVLFNGEGGEYAATLVDVNKKVAIARINSFHNPHTESTLSIHLALGISKGERMDIAIQKAVELGVMEITPLFTNRCVVQLDEKRIQKRYQHWSGVIISACEQCGRNNIPVLNTPQTLSHWLSQNDSTGIVLDPLATTALQQYEPENNAISLLIGPEGGFENTEIELACKKNFTAVKFGPRILRTETAAIAAITALQSLWGDLLN